MATVDELKEERDGHLNYGEARSYWRTGLFPKTTRVGYDAEGNVVATCRSFGPHSGEIEYGDHREVVRWERTEAGERLRGADDA